MSGKSIDMKMKDERLMKKNYFRAGMLILGLGGLALVSGCVVEPGRLVFQPPVVAVAPPVVVAPPPPEVVMVPDGYVWDGYEYVGLVGDQYFYLGPGSVWLACEPWRLERFHGWERVHPDWRGRVIINERFRRDAHGHEYPRHGDRHDDHRDDRHGEHH